MLVIGYGTMIQLSKLNDIVSNKRKPIDISMFKFIKVRHDNSLYIILIHNNSIGTFSKDTNSPFIVPAMGKPTSKVYDTTASLMLSLKLEPNWGKNIKMINISASWFVIDTEHNDVLSY